MAVKSLDTGEYLAVVSARDKDLCSRADGSLEDGERTGGELMLLDLGNFILAGKSQSYCVVGCGQDKCSRQL